MLSSEQIQKVRLVFSMEGWNDVIQPLLANRAREAIKALVLPPSERSGQHEKTSDEDLRAIIREDEWLLSAFYNEILIHDQNRDREVALDGPRRTREEGSSDV